MPESVTGMVRSELKRHSCGAHLEETHVCRHTITNAEVDDIARHEISREEVFQATIAKTEM